MEIWKNCANFYKQAKKLYKKCFLIPFLDENSDLEWSSVKGQLARKEESVVGLAEAYGLLGLGLGEVRKETGALAAVKLGLGFGVQLAPMKEKTAHIPEFSHCSPKYRNLYVTMLMEIMKMDIYLDGLVKTIARKSNTIFYIFISLVKKWNFWETVDFLI